MLGLDDSDWKNAILATVPKGEAKLVEAEPILVQDTIKPCSVTKTPNGEYLYDFGVNFTGVCRLKIKGERGQQVRMLHGEIVIDGELDMTNLSFSQRPRRDDYNQCDYYTLKGGEEETYTPRFTYHGFQYVSVSGITEEQATKDLLTFEVLHSNVQSRGSFVCSDNMLNILQESVRRSDLSNLVYIPTDCPHREKNGWTGDIALSAEQMLLNFSVEKTLADWLFSVRNAQDERGAIPGIVPTAVGALRGAQARIGMTLCLSVLTKFIAIQGIRKLFSTISTLWKNICIICKRKRMKTGCFCTAWAIGASRATAIDSRQLRSWC